MGPCAFGMKCNQWVVGWKNNVSGLYKGWTCHKRFGFISLIIRSIQWAQWAMPWWSGHLSPDDSGLQAAPHIKLFLILPIFPLKSNQMSKTGVKKSTSWAVLPSYQPLSFHSAVAVIFGHSNPHFLLRLISTIIYSPISTRGWRFFGLQ